VVTNDISRFIDKATNNSRFLRKSILQVANIAIPLKNKILGRTVDDYMAQLQSTGVCHFCNLTGVSINGFDTNKLDVRNSNLSRANLSNVSMTKAKLNNTILVEINLEGATFYMANLAGSNLEGANLTGKILML
jgi:uncharacterized protein YjbI with pentapeptide repeats